MLPDELKALAARVSNWGRWGTDDERGTLNLIDAAAVLRGAACVRRGASFGLSIPMHVSGPQTDGPGAPGRMNPTLKMKYVNVSFTGDTDDFTTTDDLLELSMQAATHIDALSARRLRRAVSTTTSPPPRSPARVRRSSASRRSVRSSPAGSCSTSPVRPASTGSGRGP